MKEAQKTPDKEAAIAYENAKVTALTVFKVYYPDASIVFNEPKAIEEVVVEEPEGPSEEELAAIKAAEELAKLEEAKAAKRAALQAELDALDD